MRIGTYFGIPLKVNPFFFLLLAVVFFYGKLVEALLLFAIVLWHESFHVLVARLYRLDVLDIELLPFGGVARLDALLQLNPQVEWVVAIVGPLSNLVLVVLAYALVPIIDVPLEWFDFFIQANLGMALFNLLPALPLDGGRVLRSLLVRRQGFKEATSVASILGQVISLSLLGWGVYGLYLGQYQALIFIFFGVMLYWAARQEQKNASYIFLRYLTHKKQELRLKRVFAGRELVATEETSLGEVLKFFQPPHYHLIWVVDLDGQILGFFGELELIQALFEQGLGCKVGTLVKYKL
ncbi:MAG: peptidase M50 [Firmicutes bacterium]|nr:peptidase M50 [Bacillota bacterium]